MSCERLKPGRNCLSATEAHSLIQFVSALNSEQITRAAAFERLRRLEETLPGVELDLAWEIDKLTGSVAYCVLATLNGEVFSLSALKRDGIPWPLRGAAHVSDDILVTVNGLPLTVASVICLLDMMWTDKELMTRVIDTALLAKECEKAAVEIGEDELGDAVRRFFLAKGLHEREQWEKWLQQRGVSSARFQDDMRYLILMEKTEKRLVGDRLQERRQHHGSEYRGLRVAQSFIPNALVSVVESVMQKHPAENLLRLIGRVAWEIDYRHVFKVEFAELLRYEVSDESRPLLDSPVGSIVLVRTTGGGIRLIELLGRESEVSEEVLQRRIVRHLVRSWYEDMRRRARIEWNWGKVDTGTTFS
jgi:putative peptide maturation system protein